MFFHKVVHSRSASRKALTKTTKASLSTAASDATLAGAREFAQVLLDIPVQYALQYRLTTEQQAIVQIGMRCAAPVGPGRVMLGIVVGLSSESSLDDEGRVRTLKSVFADPTLSPQWLQLCQFAADYYHHRWAQVALGALPPSLRRVPGPRAAPQRAKLRRPPPVQAAGADVEAPTLRDEQLQAI